VLLCVVVCWFSRKKFLCEERGDQNNNNRQFFVFLFPRNLFDFTTQKTFTSSEKEKDGGYFDGLLGVFREREQPDGGTKGKYCIDTRRASFFFFFVCVLLLLSFWFIVTSRARARKREREREFFSRFFFLPPQQKKKRFARVHLLGARARDELCSRDVLSHPLSHEMRAFVESLSAVLK